MLQGKEAEEMVQSGNVLKNKLGRTAAQKRGLYKRMEEMSN